MPEMAGGVAWWPLYSAIIAAVAYGQTQCDTNAYVVVNNASSPDGINPIVSTDSGTSGDASLAFDGDPTTYFYQADNQPGPHILQAYPQSSFDGYVITSTGTNNFSPRTWTMNCDGVTIDSRTDHDWTAQSYAICPMVGFPFTCQSIQLIITAWYGVSPIIVEMSLFQTIAPTVTTMFSSSTTYSNTGAIDRVQVSETGSETGQKNGASAIGFRLPHKHGLTARHPHHRVPKSPHGKKGNKGVGYQIAQELSSESAMSYNFGHLSQSGPSTTFFLAVASIIAVALLVIRRTRLNPHDGYEIIGHD